MLKEAGLHEAAVDRDAVLSWLREIDPARLAELYAAADRVRRDRVGDAVHLRGLVEISNHCVRQCAYCGLRLGHRELARYRMEAEEIVECARRITRLGYGTIVMQAGEDPAITAEGMERIIRRIKAETPLAITLSLGERRDKELAVWRAAGADRYLLRFETSDADLFHLIHPPLPGRTTDRVRILRMLRHLGFEVGSGIMIGIPGQTVESLADDILLFRELDLDMIGVGPFIANAATPLGSGMLRPEVDPDEQAANSEEMVYKVVALTRLACPAANIPATTALATINRASGRENALRRGANVIMPNMTPMKYRAMYEIYPNKACVGDEGDACNSCLRRRLAGIDRHVGSGPGSRRSGCRTGQ